MKPRGRLFPRSAPDPGPVWADEILAPLRREAFSCDVAPRVMRRIAAARTPAQAHTAARFVPGAAWVLWLVAGLACVSLLTAALGLMVIRGDEGVQTLYVIGASAGRLFLVFGRWLAEFGATVASTGFAIGRVLYPVLARLAPLARGGGLVGAACGLLSIVISFILVARAWRVAPAVAARGGFPLRGGSR
jgi:hypothetical protein